MKFRIVPVGKVSGPLAGSIEEFERRAARYWPLDIVVVRAAAARAHTPDEVRRDEADRLVTHCVGTTVALDERGRSMESTAFAAWMQDRREHAEDVTFVIGGAYGLDASVIRRAALRLAVAPWTLSHDLARLVLTEQIYRAGTLIRGEPYHKA